MLSLRMNLFAVAVFEDERIWIHEPKKCRQSPEPWEWPSADNQQENTDLSPTSEWNWVLITQMTKKTESILEPTRVLKYNCKIINLQSLKPLSLWLQKTSTRLEQIQFFMEQCLIGNIFRICIMPEKLSQSPETQIGESDL